MHAPMVVFYSKKERASQGEVLARLRQCPAYSHESREQASDIGEGQHGCRVAAAARRVWVAFHEEAVDADRRRRGGKKGSTLGASARMRSTITGQLSRMGDIEAHRAPFFCTEFHHVTQPDEVIHQSVVSEEAATFGEHEPLPAS